jgi:hypothetical protein
MSTADSEKLVSIIQPSETLTPVLQNATTKTRPAVIALKTCVNELLEWPYVDLFAMFRLLYPR